PELAGTGAGAFESLLELRQDAVAADQGAGPIRRCAVCRTGPLGDEAVAAARHGLDETRRGRIVVERAADLEDGHLEHAVADMGVRPAGAQQLLLRDQLSAVLDQAAQYRERLRGEGDHLVPTQEPLGREIQPETLQAQASIPVHAQKTAFSPPSNRNLTPVPSYVGTPPRMVTACNGSRIPPGGVHACGPGARRNCHPTAHSCCIW